MYASHNSLTSYPIKHWYMKLFKPFAKCQNTTIEQQLNNGVTVFDIRVRIKKDRSLVACHGFVEYDVNVLDIIYRLEKAQCYYRVILENTLVYSKNSESDLLALKNIFISNEFSHCIYVSDKKHWNSTINKYCSFNFKSEQNKHGGVLCIIPRVWVNKYKYYKDWHSLNLDKENIYYYDFIEIK